MDAVSRRFGRVDAVLRELDAFELERVGNRLADLAQHVAVAAADVEHARARREKGLVRADLRALGERLEAHHERPELVGEIVRVVVARVDARERRRRGAGIEIDAAAGAAAERELLARRSVLEVPAASEGLAAALAAERTRARLA